MIKCYKSDPFPFGLWDRRVINGGEITCPEFLKKDFYY